MSEMFEPTLRPKDRPSIWPYMAADKLMPADIEALLGQAGVNALGRTQHTSMWIGQALSRARDHGDPGLLARCLLHAARILRDLGHMRRAYAMCLEAQPLFERLDDRWLASRVLQLRAQCCLDVGERELAQGLLEEACERFLKMDDMTELAASQALVAQVHRLDDDLEAAVDWARRSVRTLPANAPGPLRRRLQARAANFHLQWGERLSARGESGPAELQYQAATQVFAGILAEETDEWGAGEAELLETAAHTALANRDRAQLRRFAQLLARCARRQHSPLARGIAWMQLAGLHKLRGCMQRAVVCARRSVQALLHELWEPRLARAQRCLADMHEARGELREAYNAHCEAARTQSRQQRRVIAMRAELMALDLEAEEALRKSEQTLAYAQRMSNVGHLVASVNHELNQPMASIRLLADTAIAVIESGQTQGVQDTVRMMRKLGVRLGDVASKLAAFPVRSLAQPKAVRLHEAVDEALTMLRSRLAKSPSVLTIELPDEAWVCADESRLVRVIANLVNNALDALVAREDRRIGFSAEVGEFEVRMRVADNGPGLSASARERLFQPFFSTKPAGQGLGLGLAMSREVMREMGGELDVGGAESGGAVFDLTLPRAEVPPAGPAPGRE